MSRLVISGGDISRTRVTRAGRPAGLVPNGVFTKQRKAAEALVARTGLRGRLFGDPLENQLALAGGITIGDQHRLLTQVRRQVVLTLRLILPGQVSAIGPFPTAS